jgi:putative nucleotidyltransferase with HDIG domain
MTTATEAEESIAVQDLRIGMFVCLDGGWLSHPFALNTFRIVDAQQIATIRSLGVDSVRWDPSRSDIQAPPADTAPPPGLAAAAPAGARALGDSEAQRRQRAAQARCERRFGASAKACRQAIARVATEPEQARQDIEALTSGLLGEMLTDEEQCIRLLRDNAGNNASTHALNVSVLSLLLGRRIGMSSQALHELGVGALLHDVGKIGLAERLHHPDDQFTPAETRAYREHVEFGVARGRQMGLPPAVLQIIAQHHEMADAGGFPAGVGSERMSDAARVVALVNAYDGLCNPRAAQPAMTPHEALAQMFTQSRPQFDTALLSAFIKLIGVYPVGTTVQLTDERLALVVSVNAQRPLKPSVLVHDAKVPREDALVLDLGEHAGLGIRRGVKPQQLPAAAVHYLAPRQRLAYYFEPARAAA